jgi:NAD(P) transhydrogenase subunit alpha
VDLAAEGGGNCELTRPGEVVETDGGAFIDGSTNLPSMLAVDASRLYARNVAALVQHLVKDSALHLDFDDEITAGCCVTHEGRLVSDRAKQLLEVVAR